MFDFQRWAHRIGLRAAQWTATRMSQLMVNLSLLRMVLLMDADKLKTGSWTCLLFSLLLPTDSIEARRY